MQMLGFMAIFPRVGIVEQLEFKFTSNQKRERSSISSMAKVFCQASSSKTSTLLSNSSENDLFVNGFVSFRPQSSIALFHFVLFERPV